MGLLYVGGGGEFLASRSWSGLQQQLGETEVKPTVQALIAFNTNVHLLVNIFRQTVQKTGQNFCGPYCAIATGKDKS